MLYAFLATTGYFWRFVPDYARKAGPICDALRKVATYILVWEKDMVDNFNIYLTHSSLVLWLPQGGGGGYSLVVHIDMFDKGLRAV